MNLSRTVQIGTKKLIVFREASRFQSSEAHIHTYVLIKFSEINNSSFTARMLSLCLVATRKSFEVDNKYMFGVSF